MALRKLAAVAPVIAVLALAVPATGASAATAPAPGPPSSIIPCYPYPAFCGPNGQSWLSFFPFPFSSPGTSGFGPGPVQLPTPLAFGSGSAALPGGLVP
jgi:hypothetical protein